MATKRQYDIQSFGCQLLVLFLPDSTNNHDPPYKLNFTPSSKIIRKTLSTFSISAFLFCFLLLIFAISHFAPSSSPSPPRSFIIRKWLPRNDLHSPARRVYKRDSSALQGLGTLIRRGNRATNELLVIHVRENSRPENLRWFLRTLHRSGVTAKADVVFILSQLTPLLHSIFTEENDYFLKLVGSNSTFQNTELSPFEPAVFRTGKPVGQTLWGKGSPTVDSEDMSWGSVVAFESAELDPEESLTGFMDQVPMQLRRWACYKMLLGRLRRRYKHAILMSSEDAFIVGDAFERFRNCKGVDLMMTSGRIVIGGMKALRRISEAMLTEIVRVSMSQHKTRNLPQDAQILEHLLKSTILWSSNMKLVPIVEKAPPRCFLLANPHVFAQLKQEICSSPSVESLYEDCS